MTSKGALNPTPLNVPNLSEFKGYGGRALAGTVLGAPTGSQQSDVIHDCQERRNDKHNENTNHDASPFEIPSPSYHGSAREVLQL